MWLPSVILGALLTAFAGIFFRANCFQLSSWQMVLLLLPTTLWTQALLAKAFSGAPRFFVAWFIGTAVCALSSFLASHFIFREHFKPLDVLAIGLILTGAVILARGS